jgi:hypothetical protein
MPRVCFEEKPEINTFYDDVEVCKRGGKKKKKKAKALISNVNKVIVNLTQGNRRRMTAPIRNMANPPKALQSITYSNPIAPYNFDPRSISSNQPMKIFKDTVEEKVPHSIPTFGALENPTGITPSTAVSQRVIPSRIPSGGVLSSAPVVRLAQETLDKARQVLRMSPSYFPPTGSASNLPKPQPAQEEIAHPSNFVPLVGAQPESREVAQQRMQIDYKIRTSVEGDPSSRIKQKMVYRRGPEPGIEKPPYARRVSNIPEQYNPGLSSRSAFPMRSISDSEGKEEKEPSKKRGGSVF